jgi:hypothetical protein
MLGQGRKWICKINCGKSRKIRFDSWRNKKKGLLRKVSKLFSANGPKPKKGGTFVTEMLQRKDSCGRRVGKGKSRIFKLSLDYFVQSDQKFISSFTEPGFVSRRRVFALRGLESRFQNHDQSVFESAAFKKFASMREQSRVLACFLERRRLVVVA